jgi:hypothetical protein
MCVRYTENGRLASHANVRDHLTVTLHVMTVYFVHGWQRF